MLEKLGSYLTYANVMATVALFVALGGTSYAVATGSIDSREVRNNSIQSADLRNNGVRSSDIRNFSLLAKDFKQGQLPAGAQGAQGPAGQDATKLWAVVNSAGSILRGSGVVSASGSTGMYSVVFNRDVTGCAYTATLGSVQAEVGQVGVGPLNGNANGVFLFTSNSAGAQEAHGFNLAVFC